MNEFMNEPHTRQLPHDTLTSDLSINISHKYRNLTRHHGEVVSIIDWKIGLVINGEQCDNEEMFVVEQFFNSLLHPGEYPMFTCTCGIFGCGGYYVNVSHTSEGILWSTERTPFKEFSELPHLNRTIFHFTWEGIVSVAQQFLSQLEHLHHVHNEHGLNFHYDTERYRKIIAELMLFIDKPYGSH